MKIDRYFVGKESKLKFFAVVVVMLIVFGSDVVWGEEDGSIGSPYTVKSEQQLKNVLAKAPGTGTTYVAITGGFIIRTGITIDKGQYMIYASGKDCVIKRSTNKEDDVNKKEKYCFKVGKNANMWIGDACGGHILYLDGKANETPFQTKGFLKVEANGIATIGNACIIKNVNNNHAVAQAGAVRSDGALNVYGHVHDCNGTKGGGITIKGGVCTMFPGARVYNCTSSSQGGGVYVGNSSVFFMKDGEIHNSTSAKEGGGIYVGGGSYFGMFGGQIHWNISGEEGGGIFGTGYRTVLNIENGWIRSNQSGASAGGVFSGYQASLILGTATYGPVINANISKGSGGGVRCNGGIGKEHGGSTIIYNAQILDNFAGNLGGGISCGSDSTITIQSVTLLRNQCEDNGGGISIVGNVSDVNGGAVQFINMTIGGNTAKNKGGGICTDSALLIRGVRIEQNAADHGGGLYVGSNSAVHLWVGNNIQDNYAKQNGGGVYIGERAKFILSDHYIHGNMCGKNGSGIYVRGVFQMFNIAQVDENNEVYLTRRTYITVPYQLLEQQRTIATIRMTDTQPGEEVVVIEYEGKTGEDELYYRGNALDEQKGISCVKKFVVVNLSGNGVLRPTNYVKYRDSNQIITSEKYHVYYDKNTTAKVENVPDAQIKFWEEDVVISHLTLIREGYEINEETHWNTKKDGSGSTLKPGRVFEWNRDLILYAQWEKEKPTQLFLQAQNRYYVVEQNICLNMEEIIKKVVVTDNIASQNQYPIYIKKITNEQGSHVYYEETKNPELMSVMNPKVVLTEKFMNTDQVQGYQVVVYAKSGKLQEEKTFHVYIIESSNYEPSIRFISKEYMETLHRNSKWALEKKEILLKSFQRKHGEAKYDFFFTTDEVKKRKKGKM